MSPRPFYRSRLFWLGLPGLVFLLWGWWLSMGYWSSVGFAGSRNSWGMGQVWGEVYAIWDWDGPPDWGNFGAGNWEVTREAVHEVKDSWAAEMEWNPSLRVVFIPCYWPALAYVATWLLTLAWWQRRKARILKLHAAP